MHSEGCLFFGCQCYTCNMSEISRGIF